jgi:Cu+-exporting ATPase
MTAQAGGCCGGRNDAEKIETMFDGAAKPADGAGREGSIAIDPVCGMKVDIHAGKPSAIHDGKTYHFCSQGCHTKFNAEPARFLDPDFRPEPMVRRRPVSAPAGEAGKTAWICPMCPEVREDKPGACPSCGMALEPETISADAGPNHELTDMTRRFWLALALTLPVVVLEMGSHIMGRPVLLAPPASIWAQLALATPVVFIAGWPFLQRAFASFRSLRLNMFSLIALGTGVAYFYSLAVTLWPGLVPMAGQITGGHGAGHSGPAQPPVYFEAAAVITTLVLLGQVLELRAREATSGAIRALMALAPKTARRIRPDGQDEDVAIELVQPGDHLRLRPGESVPADGVVMAGESALDESMLTGEAMPVAKSAGDALTGGTVNQSGALVMRVDQTGADTVLSGIVRMVAEAQRARAPIQRLVDKVAGWFVPLVMAVALLAFGAWMLFGPEPRLNHALVAAVSVLIIACPCVLGLATPMSIMVGVGRGARAGVLIRDAEALEALERASTIALDKTGTLTKGRPAVTALQARRPFTADAMLELAAGLERGSEHPLALAILKEATTRGLRPGAATGFVSVTGKGVSGMVDGRRIAIGQETFMQEAAIDHSPLASEAARLRGEGASVVFVAIDGRLAGLIAMADELRENAAAAIAALRRGGVEPVMLTGDNPVTAEAVGKALGITRIHAGMSPAGKLEMITRLKSGGQVVAMAGDGVNDAPALAAADIGIAMGTGTDVAMKSAGITLVKGDIAGVLRARRLSRATMANIRQNLFFAFIYNALGVPVAAGVLYPAFGILLSPIIAAAAMSLSSVSVIGNALRLRNVRLDG